MLFFRRFHLFRAVRILRCIPGAAFALFAALAAAIFALLPAVSRVSGILPLQPEQYRLRWRRFGADFRQYVDRTRVFQRAPDGAFAFGFVGALARRQTLGQIGSDQAAVAAGQLPGQVARASRVAA